MKARLEDRMEQVETGTDNLERVLGQFIASTKRREFDIIAVSDSTFFINETKSKPSPEDVKIFSELLKEVPDFFPEYAGKKMVPIFASLYLPEDLKKNLTRRGIYAMGAKEGTMDLLNFEQASEQRPR